ncbi:hypothetical protein ACJJTC_000202 [Scirpophaga incertulas]
MICIYLPQKLWHFLAAKVLTVKMFDMNVQGAFLMVILLEHNAFLLLRRDSNQNYIHMLSEDYVIMGLGGVQFLTAALVGWWGRRSRRLALVGWLVAAAAAALLVLALPFDEDNPTTVELCSNEPVLELSRYSHEANTSVVPALRTSMLVLTLALCSLAKVSVWAHGYTLLHDAQPHNAPHFYGILVSIQLSLGLSGKTMLEGSANDGGWWVPHLCISLLLLLQAVLLLAFPESIEKKPEKSIDDGFLESVKRVVSNKAVLLHIGAVGLMEGALFRFFQYDKEFVQARYYIDTHRPDLRSSRLVGTIFRPVTVVFFIMSWTTTLIKHHNIPNTVDCDSLTYGFTPVCGLSSTTTYYSPCDAGCHTYIDANGFISLVAQGVSASKVVRSSDGSVTFGAMRALAALAGQLLAHLLYYAVSYATCARFDRGSCQFHQPSIYALAAISAGLTALAAVVSARASQLTAEPALLEHEHS